MCLTRIEMRVEKLDWWLDGLLFSMENMALKFPHKIYEEGIMSKMCQLDRLKIVEIANTYIYTYIYNVFHKKMGVIIFKRIIKKDLVGRCQYGNIKHCRIVDVSYKDWKDGRKAWLMVRWFLIFCGKIGFQISP